jgi:hypothetical protein
VGVLERLQHLKFIIDHSLISAHVLLENNLDGNFLTIVGLCLTNNAVCTST